MILVILLLATLTDWTIDSIHAQSTMYNPVEQKCCAGKAYPRYPSKYMRCCGNSYFDSTKELCCNKQPMNMTYGINSKCCGSTVFSVQEQLCCQNSKLVSYPQEATDKTKPYYICCGGQPMDLRSNVCCNGKVNKMLNGLTSCCGDTAYNYNTEICCGSTTGSKETSLCCGDKSYDVNKQRCCYDYLNNTNNIYSVTDGDSCCLGNVYNPNTSICCFDNTIAKKNNPEDSFCCNKQVYDSDSGLCCNGKFIPSTPNVMANDMQCCGSNAFQFKTGQQCCNDTIFNTTDSICCFGINGETAAVPKKSEFATCCGISSSYDSSNEICCGEKVSPNPNGNLLCCNNTVYDMKTQTCCGDSVVSGAETAQKQCCSPDGFGEEYAECLKDVFTNFPIQF